MSYTDDEKAEILAQARELVADRDAKRAEYEQRQRDREFAVLPRERTRPRPEPPKRRVDETDYLLARRWAEWAASEVNARVEEARAISVAATGRVIGQVRAELREEFQTKLAALREELTGAPTKANDVVTPPNGRRRASTRR